ncbi:gluconate 5-dehydrogenase [Yersinia similis]|uniref:Gluconate 5-dehydrogenase n=1 Tax=Yersinia similis TaxID=367190 RepID=A0A0T9Q3W1_9GAMM|nr:gluconate 5-dehydrogenase [Yersinia similis]CFQ58155.1 gluconate 5-dehydrogenase [Yersinia similis]CNF83608.1 gluconate 5-dehydrogenase [Yersinia similis]CNH94265.1 gluconate 5-dehydrogenase [Yersinia similis]
MKNLFSLENRKVLITGSAQGIGFLLAKGLADLAQRSLLTTSPPSVLKKPWLNYVPAALSPMLQHLTWSHDEVNEAIEQIENHIGAIDVLINNAGIQRRHAFTEFPEKDWDDVIAVNQKSVFLVSQAVARYMVKRQRGKIINICSMQSELGRDTITPYAASKGAVKMLTRGMCVELARYNIQVNGIAPGYFKTDMTKALVDDKAFTDWLCKRTPAARWGDPEELIGAAVYLSSKASNFVNGHLLFVDGGMLVAV